MAGVTDSKEPEGSCLGVLTRCFDRRKDKTRPRGSHPCTPTPNSADPNNSGSPGPRNSTSPDSDDLWRRAYESLDEKTKKRIRDAPANPGTESPDWTEALVKVVQDKEEQYKGETPKLEIDGREIIWRDYAKRVVAIVTIIGDISVNFAPAPSPVVWSAIKTLMQTHVSQCQDVAAIFGCADKALNLVRRGQVYEAVYLSVNPRNQATDGLQITLVDCYKKVLELLAHASTRLKQGQGKQFLEALIRPGQGEELVSALSKCEDQLAKAAQTCESIASKEHLKLLQNLDEPIRLVKDDVTRLLERVEDNKMREVLRDISPIPFGEHHEGKRETRTPGTCEWLLKHPKFADWEASSCSSILWLQGNVGTGKSFLSSKIIDRYRHDYGANDQQSRQHDEGFAYFYCDRSDKARRKPRNILGSYIRQLAEVPHHPSRIHKDVYNLHHQASKEERGFSTDECKTLLSKLVNSYPRTTLIIDAMDECEKEDRQHLLDILFSLAREGQYPVKIFIASRLETDIHKHPGFGNLVEIGTADNTRDIEKYIEERLRRPGQWDSVSDDVKENVKSTITGQSNGMFRWAALQWEQLKGLETKRSIETRLGQLPQGLTHAYQEIYEQVELEDRLILQRTVQWVLCAKVPMSSKILLPAIWLHGRRDMKDEDDRDPEPIPHWQDFESTVESICRHLILRDSHLGEWRFAHASVAEYFENNQKDWASRAHEDVAAVLLSVLIEGCSTWTSTHRKSFEDSSDLDSSLHHEIPLKWPDALLLYTTTYWVLHVRSTSLQSKGHEEVQRLLKRLLSSEDGPRGSTSSGYQAWIEVIQSEAWRIHSDRLRYTHFGVLVHGEHELYAPDLKPAEKSIFGICALGLHVFLQGWWDKDLDVSQVNAMGLDLLALAAKYGHEGLCSALIDKGSDPNRRLVGGWETALKRATEGEHTETVRLLLNKGSDPNVVDRGSSLLCSAARKRSSDIIKIFLEKQADPNIKCQECDFGCALEAAARLDKDGTVKLLLVSGAKANLTTRLGLYGSPLAAAAYWGSLECVKLLIEDGAETNTPLEHGEFGSALAAAARSGELESAKYLIDHGAQVNAQLEHGDYGSALAAAVSGLDLECTQLLVECGAEVNAPLEYSIYGSALAAAAYRGALGCVTCLVEHGAEVNAHLEHGAFGNALIAAVYMNELACVKFLVEHGAEVNAYVEFGDYGSALAAALFAWFGGLKMIKYLIEEVGADTNVLSLGLPYGHSGDGPEGWEWSASCHEKVKYLMEEALVARETLHAIGCRTEL